MYVLSIDASTQSMTGVVVDSESYAVVAQKSISLFQPKLIKKYSIDSHTATIRGLAHGFYCQSPLLLLELMEQCLELLSVELKERMSLIECINFSVQQHGHVYCNQEFARACESLKTSNFLQGSATTRSGRMLENNLVNHFKDSFSLPYAPIWLTSASQAEADEMRRFVGDNAMLACSGSLSPARFTGAIIRYVSAKFVHEYSKTRTIHLINSFLVAVLSGDPHVAMDWGNASGMSMMDFFEKKWSTNLLEAVSHDREGGIEFLRSLLPQLCSPLERVGTVAPYFCRKYRFSSRCSILAGSGDTPQTKSLSASTLLSFGTSFIMLSSFSHKDQLNPYVSAMYDGTAQPYLCACKTNGALVFDALRTMLHMDFDMAEHALAQTPIAENLLLLHPLAESFPVVPANGSVKEVVQHRAGSSMSNISLYAACVDANLALMSWLSKKHLTITEPLVVTGGVSNSVEICSRISAFWNTDICAVGAVGASLGATIATLSTYTDNIAPVRDALVFSNAKRYSATKEQRAQAAEAQERVLDIYKTYLGDVIRDDARNASTHSR